MVSPRSPSRSASRSPSRWVSGPIAHRTRSRRTREQRDLGLEYLRQGGFTAALRERLRGREMSPYLSPSRSSSRSPSRSSAAPGRLIGSRTPSSPPGAPLRGRPRSRSNSNSNSRDRTNILLPDKWKVVKLNNPPKEDVALNNFNNKNGLGFKAIKVSWTQKGKKYSSYYTPKTVTGLLGVRNIDNWKVRRAMRRLYYTDANKVLFENPETRANVRRKNLEFVRLEKRTNKNKAATKIQAAFRGGRERQKTLNKAKRMTALITSKRKPKKGPVTTKKRKKN